MTKKKTAVAEAQVNEAPAAVVAEVESPVAAEVAEEVVDATEEVMPKKRRGKKPTKAQIFSAEDMVEFVRSETAKGTSDEAIVTRVKEIISAKFTEQKGLIVDSIWPVMQKASSKKQDWLSVNVFEKIKNSHKPRF